MGVAMGMASCAVFTRVVAGAACVGEDGGRASVEIIRDRAGGVVGSARIAGDARAFQAARQTVADSVRRSSIEQAAKFAAKVGGKTSLQSFIDRQGQWRMGDALTTEVKEQTDTTFAFNVTRCRYAETYKAMGLGDIGHLLSCNRDGAFSEGYDPKLKLDRPQTIMQGASHCDFKYTLSEEPKG